MAKREPHVRISNGIELTNSGKYWTQEEMDFIMESDLPDKVIAEKLRRTLSSITNMRFIIRNSEMEV